MSGFIVTFTRGRAPGARASRAAFLLGLCLVTLASPARADREHPHIADARRRLASYDLEGSRTLDVLTELGRFDRTEYLEELQRARFLRAAAAADVLLLAHLKNRPALTRGVAEAYDVDEDRIVSHVRAELDAVRQGVYTPIVDDAAQALDRMQGLAGSMARGPRGDIFFVTDVLAAAQSEAPVSALAHLGANESTVPFDAQGRRAVGAVMDAFRAISRLEDAAAHGDPFAAQLTGELRARARSLRAVVLKPVPAFDDSLGLGRVEHGTAVRPDLVLSVQPTEVRFAFVPSVTFENGAPTLTSDQQPMYPTMETVAMEGLQGWPRPVEELVAALRSRIDGDTVIALGGAPDAESHLLTRAWQSVVQAGGRPRWLVARDSNGLLTGIPARVANEEPRGAEVFVRLGGHSVSLRGVSSRSIPRQRTSNGWQHDWEQLAEAVGGPASLRYMSVVPLQILVETAFVVGEEVSLEFP